MNALSALGINTGNLLISTICLIIAYIIVAHFIVGPIQKAANERREAIDKGLDGAKNAAAIIADAEKQAQAILAKAEADAAEVIKSANEETIKLREDYRAQVDAETAKQLRSAKTYLSQERDSMLARLRDQIIELSIESAKKLVNEDLKLRPDRQRELLVEVFTGIHDGTFTGVDETFPDNVSLIEITTAIALTDEEKEKITAQLQARLTEDGQIVFHIDPKIIGGTVVHSGNLLIDHSISGRARELKDALHQS